MLHGADGSIEVFLQHEEPTDPVENANWFPVPETRRRAAHGIGLRPGLFHLGRKETPETLGVVQDEASVLDLDPPPGRELAQDRGRHVA